MHTRVLYLTYTVQSIVFLTLCPVCQTFVDSVTETQRLFANDLHFPNPAVFKYYQASVSSYHSHPKFCFMGCVCVRVHVCAVMVGLTSQQGQLCVS